MELEKISHLSLQREFKQRSPKEFTQKYPIPLLTIRFPEIAT